MNTWMTNPNWVAFNAHCWFAYSVLTTLVAHWGHGWVWAAGLLALAVVKEFWYDARYELPRQSAMDNVLDTFGYATGLALGLAL